MSRRIYTLFSILLASSVVLSSPTTVQSVDMAVLKNDTRGFALVGDSVQISVTLINNGGSDVTGFTVTHIYKGEQVSEGVNGINLGAADQYQFIFPTPVKVDSEGQYQAVVYVTANGDINQSNDSIDIQWVGFGVEDKADKAVVMEKTTRTGCGNCPRASVFVEQMRATNPGVFIPIAVHMQDVMEVVAYYPYYSELGFVATPTANFDRSRPNLSYSQFAPAFENQQKEATPFSVSLGSLYDPIIRSMSVSVETTSNVDISGDYRVAVIVVEDSVHGSESTYAQTNYFANNALGELVGAGLNWHEEPNPVHQSKMYFMHVARDILGSYQGQQNSLPTTMEAKTPYNYTFSYLLPESYDATQIKLVALLIDHATGNIVNAFKSSLNTGTVSTSIGQHAILNEKNISFFRAMGRNRWTASFNNAGHKYYRVTVVDMNGRQVYSNYGDFIGSKMTSFDFSSLDMGTYSVAIQTAKERHISKIVVQ